MATNDELQRLAEVYQRNLPVFCADLLKIKLEEGGLAPFFLNNTQLDLHNRLQNQLSKNGKVRAIILKPRREGMSTYIGARFYHKTIFNHAFQTYILTHHSKATDQLFNMVKIFQNEMLEEFRPQTEYSSKKELTFSQSKGGYSLATAGGTSGGRSEVAHCFHGSEVAFWANADEVASSALQIVGDMPNTEVILESTGMAGTYFQETWEKAVAGQSDYEPIFYAWYESDRNRADATGLILAPEEKELQRIYQGLDNENIAFRRLKLSTMSEAKFRREYPAVPADAFIADGSLAYISPETVEIARHRTNITKDYYPRLLGVDPSSTSTGDSCGMAIRVDDKVINISEFNRETVLERANVVFTYINKHNIDHTFIDAGGSGKEIFELLISWGLPRKNITLVYFGGKAQDNKLYPNKRNEMYSRMRNWLEQEGDIPNILRLKQELSITKEKVDSKGRYVLESKKDMRKSPNLADALALTFAHPVRIKQNVGVTSYA